MKCPNCRDKTQRIKSLEAAQKQLIVRIRVILELARLRDKDKAIDYIKYCGSEALQEFFSQQLMKTLFFIGLLYLSAASYGQYYLTDEVAIWVTETQETREFNVGLRTFRSDINIEIISHREHLQRIAAGWLETFNVGDVALLSRHYRPTPSLAFVADVIRMHWWMCENE